MPGKTIATAVRDWVSRFRTASGGGQGGRDSADQPPSWLSPLGDPVDRAEFVSRLGKVLARQRTIPAGQINIIGLDDLRVRLGDRWVEIESKVHDVCGRIIRSNLTDLDVYTRYSNSEYLIVFARLSTDAARLKCATIKQEIVSRFLGDPETKEIAIKTVVEQLDGALLFEEMTLEEILKPLAQRVQFPPPTPSSRRAKTPSKQKPDKVFVRLTSASDEGLGAPLPLDGPPKRRKSILFVYRPFWDLHHGVISTYFCLPRIPGDAANAARYGYDVLPNTEVGPIVALDFRAVRRGLKSLHALLKSRHRIVMAVPVHFETLAAPKSRDRYIRLLRSVPPDMRDFLMFELCGLPRGVAQLRVAAMADGLRPFCRSLLIGSDLRGSDLGRYAGIGVHAVGIDLAKNTRGEKEVVADLNRFVKLAEASKLQSYAHGITTTSLAVQAKAAGFAYLSGDRISPAVIMPKYMIKMSWEDFYLGRGVEREKRPPSSVA